MEKRSYERRSKFNVSVFHLSRETHSTVKCESSESPQELWALEVDRGLFSPSHSHNHVGIILEDFLKASFCSFLCDGQ